MRVTSTRKNKPRTSISPTVVSRITRPLVGNAIGQTALFIFDYAVRLHKRVTELGLHRRLPDPEFSPQQRQTKSINCSQTPVQRPNGPLTLSSSSWCVLRSIWSVRKVHGSSDVPDAGSPFRCTDGILRIIILYHGSTYSERLCCAILCNPSPNCLELARNCADD